MSEGGEGRIRPAQRPPAAETAQEENDRHGAAQPRERAVPPPQASFPSTLEEEIEASVDALLKKPRRRGKAKIESVNDAGERIFLVIKLEALGAAEYDALIAAHPPTKKQQTEGAVYNSDTFGPALIQRCATAPRLTIEQAQELWVSPDWSGGEIRTVFLECVRLCQAGLDVSFFGVD